MKIISAVTAATFVAGGLLAAPLIAAGPAGAATHHHYVAGDFDGDGRPDLALGAPGSNSVRITYSHLTVHHKHTVLLKQNAPSLFSSDFGRTLALGDFNHDGYADLAVGAPDYGSPDEDGGVDGVTTTQGAVFVFLGSRSGLHEQRLTMVGNYDGDDPFAFGSSLVAADVNADGFTDLAVADPLADSQNVRIYDGGRHGLTFKSATEVPEADSLAFSDVNGDHHPELIVGSEDDYLDSDANGVITVLQGTKHGIRLSSPQTIRGSAVGVSSQFGSAAAAGNVNGDKYGDVVVGAGGSNHTGTIVALYGSKRGLSVAHHRTINESRLYRHTDVGDLFGATLAIGKINDDAYADVVVGAPDATVDHTGAAGAVYVLRGSRNGLSLAHAQRFTLATHGVPGGLSPAAYFGSSVFLSNVAGDAHRDLLVGADGARDGASNGGLVDVLRGSADGVTTRDAGSVGDPMTGASLGAAVA